MIKNLPLLIIIILNYINIKKYYIFPYIIVYKFNFYFNISFLQLFNKKVIYLYKN